MSTKDVNTLSRSPAARSASGQTIAGHAAPVSPVAGERCAVPLSRPNRHRPDVRPAVLRARSQAARGRVVARGELATPDGDAAFHGGQARDPFGRAAEPPTAPSSPCALGNAYYYGAASKNTKP